MNNIQETGFHSMMKQLYGDFGVDSEVGRLRSVLMRRPGKEIEGITDPAAVAMKEIWDVGKVREEHDALAEIYRSNGVEVHYIEEMAPHLPNAVYARDLVLMTPEGAIVARPAAQVEEELRNMGVEHLIKVEIPRGMAHLDSFMAFADLKVALVLKIAAPDTIYRELEEREFNIVDIPDYEEFGRFCQNFVALEPGKIVMPTGCPKTVSALEKAGVECMQLDVSEIMKGNGAIHCMTAFLKRDSVPLYK